MYQKQEMNAKTKEMALKLNVGTFWLVVKNFISLFNLAIFKYSKGDMEWEIDNNKQITRLG